MTTSFKMAASLLLFLLMASLVSANFLTEPQVQWSYILPLTENGQEHRLRKGNAVVATQDDSLLFITTQDASVFMLQTSDGLPVSDAYRPPDIPGSTLSCQSGVALAEDETGVQFAVYAVLDTPDDPEETIQSRIIALNADGSERWSVSLDGVVVGTPAIGADSDVIYISHNVPNPQNNGETDRGRVTVLRDNGGIPSIVTAISPEDRFGPFGPLTVKTTFVGDDVTEVVFVAESWGGGFERNGNVYYLTSSGGEYSLELFSEWGFSSVAAPAVSADADMLWMAGVGSTVGGWVGEAYTLGLASDGRSSDPTWQSSFLQANEVDTTLETSPVVSTDNSLLFITGASDEVYCVEADSGRLQWAHDGGDRRYVARPVFRSPNEGDGVLYTISVPSGRVQQLDVQRGRRNWGHDCEDLTGNTGCEDGVEAEFSVSQSDNILYYGNVDGVIVALQVGTFATEAPVAAPTSMPTDTEPLAPDTPPATTGSPTAAPTESAFVPPNDEPANVNTSLQAPSGPSDTTTKALFAISALIVVLAIGILAYVFLSIRRRRRRKNETLPVAIGKDIDGDADTGIHAESSLDTFGDVKKKIKKKKPVNTSLSSDGSSPSRLHSIAESSIEDSSVDESMEIMHDEEEDIDSYMFDYVQTTPDTSFSSSPSVSPEKATRSPEVVVAANARSAPPEKEAQSAGVELNAVTATAAATAIATTALKSSSSSECERVPTPDNEVVVHPNGDSMTDGRLVTTDSNVARPYYMLDTRPEGAGAIIEVGGGGKTTDQSADSDAASGALSGEQSIMGTLQEGDEQGLVSDSMVRVNTGSRSAYAMDSGTSATIVERGKQRDGERDLVSISQDKNRSVYAMDPPSLSGAVAMTNARSDASSIYVEDSLDTQRLRSVKSDGAMSLASIDEGAVPPKQQAAIVPVRENNGRSSYAMDFEKNPSQYFDDQSTVTSMYLDDESTLATSATVETAPLDERASRLRIDRSHLSPTATRRDVVSPIGSTSTLSPTPQRKGHVTTSTSATSARLDAISPLTVDRGEPQQIKKKSSSYVVKAPLSPGSTIASTSVYIDDDGSVEMEPDNETNANSPLDEETTPASVKLDAIASPSQKNNDTITEPVNEVKKPSMRKSYNKSNAFSPVTRKVSRNALASSGPKLSLPPPLSPTSTCTNESQSSVESDNNSGRPQDVDVRSSARSMRKMRLEQMRLERTLRGWKSDSPRSSSTNERTTATAKAQVVSPRSTILRKTAGQSSVISGQSGTSNIAIIPKSPDSTGSVSTQDIFPSSDSDLTPEERPQPPPAPPAKRIMDRPQQARRRTSSGTKSQQALTSMSASSSSRPQQSRRSTSSSSGTSKRQQAKKASSQPRASSRGRSERSRSASSYAIEKKVETNEEAKPAAITSYFSGLMKHVEEAERQFFNPTLPAKKASTSTISSNGSTTYKRSNVYAGHSSDDDSLPPPPPSY